MSPRTKRPDCRAIALAAGLVAVLAAEPARAQQVPPAPAAVAVKLSPDPFAGVFPLDVAWSLPLESPADPTVETPPRGPACPPAYDGWSMYVVSKTGRLSAVSLGAGAVRWTVSVADARGVAASDGLVFLAAGTGVSARRGADGTVVWELPLGAAASGNLRVEGGWLIAATGSGDLVGIRAREGSKVWQVNGGAKLAGVPAIAGDGVYVPLENDQVRRLDLLTGQTVWQRTLLARPRAIVALEERIFVTTTDRYLYALDPGNQGRVHRRIRTPEVAGTPAVGPHLVNYLALDNVLRAVDRVTGTLKWEHVLEHRALFGPIPAGSLLFASGVSNVVGAWSAAAGTPVGTFEAPNELAGPLHIIPGLIARDLLIVGLSQEGIVLAMRPASLAVEPFVAAPPWPTWIPLAWRWR
jgi:outer membrane protein assembly factor BamB